MRAGPFGDRFRSPWRPPHPAGTLGVAGAGARRCVGSASRAAPGAVRRGVREAALGTAVSALATSAAQNPCPRRALRRPSSRTAATGGRGARPRHPVAVTPLCGDAGAEHGGDVKPPRMTTPPQCVRCGAPVPPGILHRASEGGDPAGKVSGRVTERARGCGAQASAGILLTRLMTAQAAGPAPGPADAEGGARDATPLASSPLAPRPLVQNPTWRTVRAGVVSAPCRRKSGCGRHPTPQGKGA